MAGQERAAAAHHAWPAGLDGAGAFLDRGVGRAGLLGHHGGDAAAARRAVEQADRGRSELDRQPVEITRLLADRAVGMAAARGEVVGADDAGAALEAALAADMAGRREFGDVAVVVERGEARQAADLAEAAGIEQNVDALAAGELAAVALAHHAGIGRAGRQPPVGDRLQGRDLLEHRGPAVVRRHRRRGPGGAGRRLEDGQDLPALDRVADGERRQGLDRAGAGCGDRGLHLHGADDKQQVARLHLAARARLDVDDGARMRAFDRLVPGRHRQGTGRRRVGGASPAPEGCDLLVEELQRARLCLWRVDGLGEQGGARIAGPEVGMRQDGAQLLGVGRHAHDVELVERAGEMIDRRVERARRARLADELGQQRIELRRRRQADVAAGIDPHARPRRFAIGGERAGALGHDARLHGIAARHAGRLLVGQAQRGQRSAGGDAELRLDQVEAHDLLGDGVLDLDARIALDEEVLARFGIDQELHGAGILVARGAGQRDRVGQDALAQAWVEVGRGRDLDDLLVAQLHRAVALEEMHDIALAVAQHLDLDMPWPRHDLLQEQRAVAERGLGLALGSARRRRPSLRAWPPRMPRPPPPAEAFSITG